MALGKLTRNTHGDPAVCVAGVDGTPGGWAVIIKDPKKSVVKKFASIADLFHEHPKLRAVAIDIPIGLLDGMSQAGVPAIGSHGAFLVEREAAAFFLLQFGPPSWRRPGTKHTQIHVPLARKRKGLASRHSQYFRKFVKLMLFSRPAHSSAT